MMKNHDNITIIHKWKKTWNTLWKWGERYRKLFGSLKVVDGLFLNKTLVSFHLFLPWKPRDWITWSVAERDTTGAPIKQCLCRPIQKKRRVKLSELEILQKLWSKWLSNSKSALKLLVFPTKSRLPNEHSAKLSGQKFDVSLGKAQKNPTKSRWIRTKHQFSLDH